jgi:uncharacterized protein
VKVQGSYTFEAPLDTVWAALFDPEVLARTLPGCEKLEREGNTFKGDINVKMGPVQGKFQGKVDIIDVKERESYTMLVDGRGPAGFGKATALLRVAPEGTGTRLDYDSDVTVGGKIASVGQRLLDASSRAIVKQSLETLHEQIKALPAAKPAVAPAPVPAAVVAAGAPASTEAAGAELPSDVGPGAESTGTSSPAADAWFDASSVPAASTPDAGLVPPDPQPVALRPAPAAPRGPSQAAFAFGVAKEVTKELLPAKTVVLIIALGVLVWLVIRSLS